LGICLGGWCLPGSRILFSLYLYTVGRQCVEQIRTEKSATTLRHMVRRKSKNWGIEARARFGKWTRGRLFSQRFSESKSTTYICKRFMKVFAWLVFSGGNRGTAGMIAIPAP
jgi:hypothetical protein